MLAAMKKRVRFQDLAANAKREWEGVYGYNLLGQAWELAGDYEQAAAAFASLAAAYPEHRLWLDALYRQGINLARTNNPDAQTVIDALLNYRATNPLPSVVGRNLGLVPLRRLWLRKRVTLAPPVVWPVQSRSHPVMATPGFTGDHFGPVSSTSRENLD